MTREAILKMLQEALDELFEISPAEVVPSARLYEDLDLDSIDAVDLIVHIQAVTEKRVSPEEFKSVRTVDDILNCVEKLIAEDDETVG